MVDSGINKLVTGIRRSFGDWSLERELLSQAPLYSEKPAIACQPGRKELPGIDIKKIVSRRAAAYWEIQK